MKSRVLRVGKPLIILVAVAALGWLVKLLWNAVMPVVFVGAHSIDYWHAIGLLVLSRVLFGGFRGGGGWRRHRQWHRYESMTPDEREHFKRSFSGRFGT